MVNIFGIKFEDPIVDILFWIVFIVYVILDSVIIIVTFKKLICEIKSVYSDLLKIMQFSAIIITFIDLIAMDFVELIDLNLSKYFSLRVTTDLFEMFLLYYMLNQLSWYLLILHISKYRLLTQGLNYQNIRTQIRSMEKKALIIIVVSYIFLRVIWLVNDTLVEFAHDPLNIASRIYHSIYALVAFILVLNELRIYNNMKWTMIKYLNYYYKSYCDNIRKLKFANLSFYATFGLIHLGIAIFGIQLDSIVGLSTIKDYHSISRLVYLVLNVILNTPLFLYVFINTYNIKFKEWIFAVLWGYKISKYYGEWSIFITKFSGVIYNLILSQASH